MNATNRDTELVVPGKMFISFSESDTFGYVARYFHYSFNSLPDHLSTTYTLAINDYLIISRIIFQKISAWIAMLIMQLGILIKQCHCN
jgi:hypothetical protein